MLTQDVRRGRIGREIAPQGVIIACEFANQNAQQHSRMIRRRAGAAITAAHRAKVEPVDHLHNEASQMLLRQPLVNRRRQQKPGLPIDRAEVAHPTEPVIMRESMRQFYRMSLSSVKPDRLLERALSVLDARPDTSELEIAQREYAYFPLLEFSNRKLRLHDLMASDPAFYHQILRNVFPGDNEPNVEADEPTKARARMSYSLLSHFSRIPGPSSSGIDGTFLTNWIDELRRLGVETDCPAVTDNYIGRMLAHAASDADGGWPDRAVRYQIERLASDEMERGLRLERFNMRGVHGRQVFEGGDQERDLARSYASDAKIAEAWPRTSTLLGAIAREWEEDAKREDVEAAQRKLRS